MASDKKFTEHQINNARDNIADTIGRFIQLTQKGAEYSACCPFHDERTPSFTVNDHKGFYHCFGCGAHGDAIDFVMNYEGRSFPDAVERITGDLPNADNAKSTVSGKTKPQKASVWRAIKSPPVDAPEPDFTHYRHGFPSNVWPYTDPAGNNIGYVCRFEFTNEDGTSGKETIPMTWAVNTETGAQQWRFLSFATPRPLYRLHELNKYPQKKVIVVEGEKTAEAAASIFKGMVVVAWPGGGNAVNNADLTPLYNRNVTLWPDFDWKEYKSPHKLAGQLMPEFEQPGIKAMYAVYESIKDKASSIRIIRPIPQGECPSGWDLADEHPYKNFDPVEYAKSNSIQAADYFAEIKPIETIEAQEEQSTPTSSEPIFGDPIDVFGVQSPKEIPVNIFPDCMQEYIKDNSDRMGCDPGMIGMSALVSAAACIHDGIRIMPKKYDTSWKESARLWCAIVADPSSKKSPAISVATAPVMSINYEWMRENAAAMSEYKQKLEDFKESKKAKRAPGDEPLPDIDPAPAQKQLIVDDITIERLAIVLKDNTRGVLCLQDELTAWFASMDAYKSGGGKGANKDRAKWLKIYNGGQESVQRITREDVLVENWSACMIGGIQPGPMKMLSKDEDGLIQRFMIICSRSANKGQDRTPNHTEEARFDDIFRRLIQLEPDARHLVKLSDAALTVIDRCDDLRMRLLDCFDQSDIKSWIAKFEGLYPRLLLTYHVIDCAHRGVYPTDEHVSKENAEKVEKLLYGHLIHHGLHFYNEIAHGDERLELVRQLAKLILAKKYEKITKRNISQQWKAARFLQPFELRSIINTLCTFDWLIPDITDIDTADGKVRSWFINPKVHEEFYRQTQKELERRRIAVETFRELRENYAEF